MVRKALIIFTFIIIIIISGCSMKSEVDCGKVSEAKRSECCMEKLKDSPSLNCVEIYEYDESESACTKKCEEGSANVEFCGISTYSECRKQLECVISGCANQVCMNENEPPPYSTCKKLECNDYEKFGMKCGCVDNECKWVKE